LVLPENAVHQVLVTLTRTEELDHVRGIWVNVRTIVIVFLDCLLGRY
jgi:hypothetical protein